MLRIIAAALFLLGAFSIPAGAQMLDSQPVVSSKAFTRDFGGGEISCQFTLRAGGVFEPGQRAWLQVDLDSSTAGADLRAAVINGFIVFALPAGLEPDGQPRLLFYNEAEGRYDYMYSKAYPRLDRLASAGTAFANAASNDPQLIRDGLAQISLALDDQVRVVAPASHRLLGEDRGYSLTGVSWLLPANVYMKDLVNLFDPEPGQYTAAKLRVVLQVKTTGELSPYPVEVFTGGLSAAMHQMELLPSQLPPTAIPLAPLPALDATTAAAQGENPALASGETADTAGQTVKTASGGEQEAEGESAPVQQPPSRSQNSRQPTAPVSSAGQDEQPANNTATSENSTSEAAPPPLPIPAMVYSYEWLAWETQFTPSANPAGANTGTPLTLAEPGGLDSDGQQNQFELPEELALEQLTPETPLAGSASTPEPKLVTQPTTPPDPPRLERPQREPTAAAPADSGSSAHQVAPGTLPTEPQEYTVPLKEISASASSFGNEADNRAAADGASDFRLKPNSGSDPGSGAPNVITSQLPSAAMNMPAPEGLDEMILIPAGPFLMGTASGQGGDADEQPQAEVDVAAYYIDKYPVTNRQFHNFVISAGYKPEGNWQKYYAQGTADMPVRGVSHADAEAFARWAGKRLPTEAEWEKAARGTDGRTYPWGEDWSAEIMPRGDETTLYAVMTAPKSASPYGVMGMSGLVWQWTASAYTQAYPFDPAAKGDKFVLRGGAYSNGRGVIRCANRYFEPGNVALNTFGFRCVKDAP